MYLKAQYFYLGTTLLIASFKTVLAILEIYYYNRYRPGTYKWLQKKVCELGILVRKARDKVESPQKH